MINKHYTNAPVIEAVIGFQTQASEISDNSINSFCDELKDKFPTSNPISKIQMEMNPNPNVEDLLLSSTKSSEGFRLINVENSRIIQAKRDGMTYSHLPPYTEWETFVNEAKDIWRIYTKHCKPSSVIRVGLRYINRVDLPHAKIELEEFFTLYPHVPKTLSQQDIAGMQLQLNMPQNDLNSLAIIQEALVDPAIPSGISLILDIDIFTAIKYQPGSSKIWNLLNKLRTRKNDLFEAFITDKTREIIK